MSRFPFAETAKTIRSDTIRQRYVNASRYISDMTPTELFDFVLARPRLFTY